MEKTKKVGELKQRKILNAYLEETSLKRTTNKILGIILVVALLFNTFALMAFASTTDGQHVIELTMKVDKEQYAPGDELWDFFANEIRAPRGQMVSGVKQRL